MSYFDFKLNSIKILNNRDIGRAELKIMSFVSDSTIQFDTFTQLKGELDDNKKLEIIRAAANQIIGYREFIQIDNIKDNQTMKFGVNGYSLFRSNTIPEYFDWSFVIFESDEKARKVGELLTNLTNSESFNGFAKNVMILAGAASNPVAYASLEVAKFVGKAVGGLLMLNADDQIAVFYQSFNKYEDYPGLDTKWREVDDLTSNAKLDYSIFGRA